MKKHLEEQAELLLQQIIQPLAEAGFTYEPRRYEGGDLNYRVLAVTDANGEEDVAIDAHDMEMNGQEYLLLQYKCVLIAEIEEELLPELRIWQERANILMPLGSLVLVGRDLLMRYSLLCPAGQLPEQSLLNAATELFFMQRILYANIGVDLLVGEISLEEAMNRLLQREADV